MKKFLFIFITAVFIIGGLYIYFKSKSLNTISSKTQENVRKDYIANFTIVTNGTTRVFTDSKYHNRSDSVYIQADDPSIIYIKEEDIFWKDFFATLPMELTKDCLYTGTGQEFCDGEGGALTFYLNGLKEDDLLELEIKNNDKALILFGNYSESQVQSYFSQL